jgi:hypothetical protein
MARLSKLSRTAGQTEHPYRVLSRLSHPTCPVRPVCPICPVGSRAMNTRRIVVRTRSGWRDAVVETRPVPRRTGSRSAADASRFTT